MVSENSCIVDCHIIPFVYGDLYIHTSDNDTPIRVEYYGHYNLDQPLRYYPSSSCRTPEDVANEFTEPHPPTIVSPISGRMPIAPQ